MTKIMIDPGHGGKDPGCVSEGAIEAEIVFSICTKLRMCLELFGGFAGVTREMAEQPSFIERRSRAIKSEADLVVLVHCDAGAPTACGLRCYYLPEDSSAKKTAEKIQRCFPQELAPPQCYFDRAAKDAFKPFAADKVGYPRAHNVLSAYRDIDAVLVECGFLTHPRDRVFLKSESGQDQVALAIASCVLGHSKSA